MKVCIYCGRSWKAENECCAYCGAPVKVAMNAKYDPFYYDGHIVYCTRDYSRDVLSYTFYKGITLMGQVDISYRELEELSPSLDYMPMILARLNR